MKFNFLLALSLFSGITFAQGKFITDAGIAINTNDFEEAKSAIEKAEEVINQKQAANEKLEEKDLRKFWRYKEHIFVRLAEKQTDSLLKLNYLEKSKEASYKYFEVDKTKYYETEVKEDMVFLSSLYQNVGVDYFNKKDFPNAFLMFEVALGINKFLGKDDFRVYHNAAFAAFYAKNYDKAISYFNVLISNNYNEQKSLLNYKKSLIRAYSDQGNKEMALKKLSEFNSGDTANVELLKEEISILLEMNKPQEALKTMDKLVNMGQKDALTYENMGKLYEQIGDKDKALSAYKEALSLDSSKADSYYGIGKIICHEYNDINQEINTLIKKHADEKVIAAKEKESVKKADEALVYIEKALQYAPNDKDSLKLLLQIYENLDRKDKATEIKEKLSHLN